MGFLDRITSKVSREITEFSLPNECKTYLHYVQYNLEGFDFKDHIVNKAIDILKDEYTYYQNNKDTHDFKTATSKSDRNTFAKDFMNKRENFYCAEALAFLLMYHIIFYCKYYFHGRALEIFKKHIIQELKNMDRAKIPESFFYHYGVDDYFREEQEKQEDLTKKYLDLYDAYTKVRLKLSEYEDNE